MSGRGRAFFLAGFGGLIPVIPPGATLSEKSKIDPAMVGKIPGRKNAAGKWSGFPEWTTAITREEDVEQWDSDGASIGLRAAYFPAIDIDVTDPKLVEYIRTRAHELLGFAPIRVGNAPKELLLYATQTPFKKTRLHIQDSDGVNHLVECLGDGQHFVVAGVHPKTLREYTWDNDPVGLGAADLAVITYGMVSHFLGVLKEELEDLGYICEREGAGGLSSDAAPDQGGLASPSLDALTEAVEAIENKGALNRDDYLKVGYAIKAAGGEEALPLFVAWACSWPGNVRFPTGTTKEVVESDWARLRPPYRLGWNYLVELAKPAGYSDAAEEFAPVSVKDSIPVPESPPPAVVGAAAVLYSEQYLAEVFLKAHGHEVRSVPAWKGYIVWDGTRWAKDSGLRTEALAASCLRTVADRVARINDRPALARAEAISTAGKVSSVLQLAKADPAIVVEPGVLDANPWLLNTPSGVVDLELGVTEPHRPDALQTKITAVGVGTDDCPRWKKFLMETAHGDQDLVNYLQRLAGYCLTGSVREQSIIFVWGSGGNGKTVFLNTLSRILGDYASHAPAEILMASKNAQHPTALAGLQGARLVTADETEEGRGWDEARVKMLTGAGEVSARFLYGNYFKYVPQLKLVVVGNHKPEIRNLDDAMRRRLHLVPFTAKPRVVDQDLAEKLFAEGPAILAWMIEGCLAWQREGLSPPASVRAATSEYFSDEDVLGRWLADECVVDISDAGMKVTRALSSDLFASWRDWCYRNGEPGATLRRFVQQLVNRRFMRWQDHDRKRGFKGLALKTTNEFGGV